MAATHGQFNRTRVLQPVATYRQLPYLHKPAIVIVTSFATELAMPTVTDVRPYTRTLPRLIYKDSPGDANVYPI